MPGAGRHIRRKQPSCLLERPQVCRTLGLSTSSMLCWLWAVFQPVRGQDDIVNVGHTSIDVARPSRDDEVALPCASISADGVDLASGSIRVGGTVLVEMSSRTSDESCW